MLLNLNIKIEQIIEKNKFQIKCLENIGLNHKEINKILKTMDKEKRLYNIMSILTNYYDEFENFNSMSRWIEALDEALNDLLDVKCKCDCCMKEEINRLKEFAGLDQIK
jgi:DNA-binding transcriptional MerR regulator